MMRLLSTTISISKWLFFQRHDNEDLRSRLYEHKPSKSSSSSSRKSIVYTSSFFKIFIILGSTNRDNYWSYLRTSFFYFVTSYHVHLIYIYANCCCCFFLLSVHLLSLEKFFYVCMTILFFLLLYLIKRCCDHQTYICWTWAYIYLFCMCVFVSYFTNAKLKYTLLKKIN
jgi:hypothetical protein